MNENQQELFPPLHYSLQRHRLMHKFPTNPERIYAAEWFRHNKRNGAGWRALEHILDPDLGKRTWYHMWRSKPVVTHRDAVVAACVIQWLGTNCGLAFVKGCERKIAAGRAADETESASRRWACQEVRNLKWMETSLKLEHQQKVEAERAAYQRRERELREQFEKERVAMREAFARRMDAAEAELKVYRGIVLTRLTG